MPGNPTLVVVTLLSIVVGLLAQAILFLIAEAILTVRSRRSHLLRKMTADEQKLPNESREYLSRILPFISIIFVGVSLYMDNSYTNAICLTLYSASILFALLSFKVEPFIDLAKGVWFTQQWLFNYSMLLFSIGFGVMIRDAIGSAIDWFLVVTFLTYSSLYVYEFFRDLCTVTS